MASSALELVKDRRGLAVAVAGTGAALLALRLLLRQRLERFQQVPGWWLLGVVPELKGGELIVEKMEEWAETYGAKEGVFEFNMAGSRVVCPCGWEHTKALLALRPFKMQKFKALGQAKDVAAGSFFSEGERWKRERRIISPAFNQKNVQSYAPDVECVTQQLLEEIQKDAKKGEVDFSGLLPLFTADVLCKTALGQELNLLQTRCPDLVNDVQAYFDATQSRMFAPLPYWKIPGIGQLIDGGLQVKRRFDQRCSQTMAKANSGGRSIAEKLMAMQGDKFSHRELLDNLTVLFAAGTDTTSLVLSWVFYNLSLDQKLQDEVAKEVAALPRGEVLCEQLESLRMVRALWLETLRFHGPGNLLGLENSEEVTVAGRRLPPGTQFMIPVGFILRKDPEVKKKLGDDLDSFRPSRWLGPEGIISHAPFDTLPFGFGPRICVGMRLAEYEGLLAIVRVLQRFVLLEWEKPAPQVICSFVANQPVKPISIRVQPRTP